MEKRYKIIWKGQEAGPYTLEQIQMMLDSRQIGLAHQVVMDGKRVLMTEFLKFVESEQQQAAQQVELKRLEEERQAKHVRQMDMIKAQESQRESEHRREIEMQQGHALPPALPPQLEDSPQPGYPPQPVAAETGGNPAAKAGGGLTVFVIVALGFLWYQGYWDPSDIKGIWGQSKSIEVIRNNKFGDSGKTIGQAIANNMTGVEWKSKRGKSREEVIITCTGDVKEDSKSYRIEFLWVVNKGDKAFQMTEISIDGSAIEKDKWSNFIVLLLLD